MRPDRRRSVTMDDNLSLVRIPLHDETKGPDSHSPCALTEYRHALQVQADASAGDTEVSRHRRLRSDE